jgi:hypothetical protein
MTNTKEEKTSSQIDITSEGCLNKIHEEIFKDCKRDENGVPIISSSNIYEVLKKYGMSDATGRED